MPTKAETYFLEQLAGELPKPNDVIASGYFRTYIGENKKGVALFADAVRAPGHFLALTKDKLLVVKTRAPATSSPLLENKGVVVVALADIGR